MQQKVEKYGLSDNAKKKAMCLATNRGQKGQHLGARKTLLAWGWNTWHLTLGVKKHLAAKLLVNSGQMQPHPTFQLWDLLKIQSDVLLPFSDSNVFRSLFLYFEYMHSIKINYDIQAIVLFNFFTDANKENWEKTS